jgi:regulator of cell morphogenesis and NO signaling
MATRARANGGLAPTNLHPTAPAMSHHDQHHHHHHSHHQPALSPPGTPLAERSVGELVAERPGLSRVFQRHGLDFCCQGALKVREACKRKHVSLETVVHDLEQALTSPAEPGENPAQLPMPELVQHIITRYHDHLRREIPRLNAMAQRVAHVHGGHTPSLVTVSEVFEHFAEELGQHMEKEEIALFPAILRLQVDDGETQRQLDAPIRCMMQEHEDAGDALARLRELTNGFVPPPEACNTYRALFAGLAELENDMHHHVHLENSVLFPAALALAGPN